MSDALKKLVDQCIWSNRTLVDFLIAEKIDDAAILKLACHIARGEIAWFQRIRGEPIDPEVFRICPLEELRILFEENAKMYESLLPSDLSRVIAYRRFNGDAHQSSIEDMLLHLCTHGFHHRGQIATLISKLGKRPPNLDFITYCRTNNC